MALSIHLFLACKLLRVTITFCRFIPLKNGYIYIYMLSYSYQPIKNSFFLKVCPEIFQGHISSLSEALSREFRCKSSPVWAQADETSGLNGGSLQVSAARAVCVPGPLGLECMCPTPQEPRHLGPLVRSWWTVLFF